jgi:eukaryotic-like serine/threonine-protein kinase
MALTAGTRLCPYEITAQIGVGGMGEVWSATDTNLGRQVAIKILPDAFAEDPDRLARFEREAKTLASLNHPNIAIIHGLEKADGTRALVMELVEGPTLADRIAHARIPIDEALPIAKQIAEALEAAHEQGVIHRDLKPSNIKLRADGMVKVLDFGLAKALERVSAPSASTVTSPAMTGIGTILGTAAYMSPEQALGKSVDRRADIWAFGCVLYEMLTGRMAFRGEAVTDTLAAVIRADPDWSVLPTSTPHAVRALVRRCLHKDPRQRLQAIGEARIQCEEVRSDAAESESHPSRMRPWTSWVVAALVGAVIAATTAGLIVWNVKPSSSSPRTVRRFSIVLPPGQRLAGLTRPAVSFSPDGSLLAYVATTQGEGARQIYLRSMESGETRPIRGTEGTINPFFSPDGQWLGFYTFEGNAIMKIPVKGGVAQRVTGDVITWGTTWGAEHAIVFAPYLSVLQQATENGGKPEPLTHFEKGRPNTNGRTCCPAAKQCSSMPSPIVQCRRSQYSELRASVETCKAKRGSFPGTCRPGT